MTDTKPSADAITWLLRIAVSLQCFGYAWKLGTVHDSPLFSLLWSAPDVGGLGLSENAATRVEQLLALLLCAAALSTLTRPSRLLIWFAALVPATLAYATMRMNSGFQADISWLPVGRISTAAESLLGCLPWLTTAGRIALPLTLLAVFWSPERKLLDIAVTPAAERIARVAIALTFASHGFEALQHYGPFIDMLIVSAESLFSWRLPEYLALKLLTAIGVIDLLAAALVVLSRSRSVAWYMACWGLITAAARLVAYGVIGGWYPCVIRSAHWALPLMLALAWRRATRQTQMVQSSADA